MAPNSTPIAFHEMVCEAQTDAEALFVCMDEACGRRVVVGKAPPRLTVIDRGDFSVRHAGSTGGLAIDQVAVA
jgi:hypothetical protein